MLTGTNRSTHTTRSTTVISPQHLALILPGYESYLESEHDAWLENRQRKTAFVEEHFTLEGIEELDEGTLRELIHLLGAFRNWTNQDWLYGEILKSGIPAIRDALWQLLYGDALLESRFDFVKESVRMMGAAAISELLALHDPTVYPIWNRRSRAGLIRLGADRSLLPRSTQISGAQYASYASMMRWVLNEVHRKYPAIRDFLDLDLFFSYLALEDIRFPEPEPDWEIEADDFRHDEVVDQLLQLGDGLGFEVEPEVAIVPGCRVDVVWRTRIANLGTISYAFEVHRKGSRDSAIMNLQRVGTNPTVQKVVFVASRADLEMFRREVASLPESFRVSVGYFEIGDLMRALEHLHSLKTILNSLGLLSATGLFD